MSRKNRFFKLNNSIPSAQRPSPLGRLERQDSAAVPDGTTTEPMPQAVENLTATEVSCRFEIVNGISIRAINSGISSMEPVETGTLGDILDQALPVEKKLTPKMNYPVFSIAGTACCGQHVLSGYQNDHYTPEALIGGIKKTYIEQAKYNQTGRQHNNAAGVAYRSLPEDFQVKLEFGHPYPVTLPESPAAMIVFTWNSVNWDRTSIAFAAFVKARGLGECMITNGVVNPNSHNTIKSMIWNINKDEYNKFVKDLEV